MYVNVEVADCYQNLFNHLSKEHNLTLNINEMDAIIKESLLVIENVNKKVECENQKK